MALFDCTNNLPSFWLFSLFCPFLFGCGGTDEVENKKAEQILLSKIRTMTTGEERDQLIKELESAPEQFRTFYKRWLFIHDVSPFWDCWSDNGYDPSKSQFERDIQILAATAYGKSDIDNGGFHQFFGNGTGVFAPEMAEWLDRSGLTDAANVVQDAIDKFGPTFPRSQSKRQEFLARIPGDSRKEWDPFRELDNRFYDATEDEQFDAAANEWLRQTCGIQGLLDTGIKK